MKFSIPESDQTLEFTETAVDVFRSFRQSDSQAEVGGLLFAEFQLPEIIVKYVSKPNSKDRRSRLRFFPDRLLQRSLINRKFKQGLHLIGEWHTHPELDPTPSSMDIDSMSDMFKKSNHELNGFVLVIVGSATDELNIWVSKHDEKGYQRLVLSKETS